MSNAPHRFPAYASNDHRRPQVVKALQALLVILCAAPCSVAWAKRSDGTAGSTGAVNIEYENPEGDRYRTVIVLRAGRPLYRLLGDSENFGTYERQDKMDVSPNGRFVLLHRVESGALTTSEGVAGFHERYYCEILDVDTGCVVERETGEICDGTFTVDNQWKSQGYPALDLARCIAR